jgi:eukaryotic-like serine/threonine-protein kinase
MTSNASERSPSSGDSAALAQLSPEQRERLTQILDRYLSALERDAPLAKEELLAEHPDLAEPLVAYFRSLEELHSMAAGFGGAQGPVEPPHEQAPGGARRIGDFELVREIGRGGMGVVYEARQISLDRRVAVKLLPFAAVLDARQIARFKHEAQAAAQLHHPNIVPVFAIGVERGVHYYAMQYIDGQPLDRAMEDLKARRGKRRWETVRGSGFGVQRSTAENQASTVQYSAPSTECDGSRRTVSLPMRGAAETLSMSPGSKDLSQYYRQVAELGIQAAEALDAAHEYGVVHRDIKPSNLLLGADGKLWVTDFGLARFQRDATLTRTGDIVGTMRYMSPEQASGQSARVDHRTDVYSLGVTLYELVCLRPAFPEERGPALLKQIDSYDPPRLRDLAPGIPSDLETVIFKAMAREREERYASAREMADDLRCVVEGKATAARPPTTLDRAGRWARRHRRLVATAAALLLVAFAALFAGTIFIGQMSMRSSRNAARADRLYKNAQHMLDQLGQQLAEDLRDVPGADHVHRKLLEQTRSYYLDFIAEAKSDPQLRLDAAATYAKLGSLLDQLGAADEALAAHREAARLLDAAAGANPGDFQTARLLAVAENNVGLALARLGKSDEAQQHYDSAIRRQERLLARVPDAVDVTAELAASLCNLGLLQHQRHERSQAAASFQLAVERLERLANTQPTNVDHRRKLAAAYNNLGATYYEERPIEAAKSHEQALRLLDEISAASAADLSLRRDLALTQNNLGAALARAGQHAAARSAYEQAIVIREDLAGLAPSRASYRSDVAVSQNNLGMLENRLGDFATAQAHFRRAIELYEALLVQFPGDFAMASNLGGVYNNLGVALERGGQLEGAAAAFATAIDRQRAVREQAPDFPRSQELLLAHQENLGRVLRKLGRLSEAAQSAVAIEEKAPLPDPTGGQP